MSGHVSSKRRRKVRREMVKDEIRCCVDAFEDYIGIAERRKRFTSQKYNRPTSEYGMNHNLWQTMK